MRYKSTKSIKKEFGRRFRQKRKNIQHPTRQQCMSRQCMADKLGMSPKTIQSWEMGRTFPENLSMVCKLDRMFGINVPENLSEII